ncbi:pyridoxamine 5'-phosphate oxidase [Agitococcus lubricus]|uniref:Pyridoxine/pyridoxamine 5'-phosphate oxidase n=1 Tax=Agitococcus lubricus TaxID=1077255 RepID=A0A2T5J3G7_9GAMM|nr:pyridoxamine 5'-phosphate oxidase [Agitococcus lubricus]PTQ91164.1 pyridoxamine 5'-phosphate oxidase [Agitococcus lubricus]
MKQLDIASIRQDYSKKELSVDECLADPIAQFSVWLDEAIQSKVNEPTAMNLATVSAEGKPSARMVLLKGVEEQQFVFYSNYQSRKGEQMAVNAYVALTFFWPELERQVRIEGKIEQVKGEISDAYFQSRPYSSRVGAWASEQSRPLDAKSTLVKRAAFFAAKYITHVPRPPHWGGYAVAPERIEFWQGRPSRLHDRVVYCLSKNDWQKACLFP